MSVLRDFRRWRGERCADCGQRFRWKEARHSYGNEGEVFHSPCISYQVWRRKAEERLIVLDVVADLWGVDAPTVREVMAGRPPDGYESSNAWDLAWRVFYDLQTFASSANVLGGKASNE